MWKASAPRLIDNSFDPAHTSFVHRGTFGSEPRVEVPHVERNANGILMRTEVKVKQVSGLEHITGDSSDVTVRYVETTWWAPFFRVLDQTYPSGVRHTIAMAATPVDDTHLRLVQWVMRTLVAEGFTPVVPPVLVREQAIASDAGAYTFDLSKGSDLLIIDVTGRPGVAPEALEAAADKALALGTGARGLRSVLEGALLETMYTLPTAAAGSRFTVTPGIMSLNTSVPPFSESTGTL